jgi:hypothetical protein
MPALPENWTTDDAVKARAIFGSPTWAKMIAIMMSNGNRPRIEGNTKDERYDSSLKRQTWEDCLNTFTIFSLTTDPMPEDELQQVDPSKFSSKPPRDKFTGKAINER